MVLLGLAAALFGFLLAVLSLGVSDSTGVRMGMSLAGILISLAGIIGVINKAYLKDAIWKK